MKITRTFLTRRRWFQLRLAACCLWLYSHVTHTVSAVVVPGVTPAPAGGTFTGVDFGVSLNNRGEIVFAGIVATDKGIHPLDEK